MLPSACRTHPTGGLRGATVPEWGHEDGTGTSHTPRPLTAVFQAHHEVCPKFPLTCDGCGKKKISREKVSCFRAPPRTGGGWCALSGRGLCPWCGAPTWRPKEK